MKGNRSIGQIFDRKVRKRLRWLACPRREGSLSVVSERGVSQDPRGRFRMYRIVGGGA